MFIVDIHLPVIIKYVDSINNFIGNIKLLV